MRSSGCAGSAFSCRMLQTQCPCTKTISSVYYPCFHSLSISRDTTADATYNMLTPSLYPPPPFPLSSSLGTLYPTALPPLYHCGRHHVSTDGTNAHAACYARPAAAGLDHGDKRNGNARRFAALSARRGRGCRRSSRLRPIGKKVHAKSTLLDLVLGLQHYRVRTSTVHECFV